MERINSLENKKVMYWNKLKLKKHREKEGLFLVEGSHLVEEAIKSGYAKEIIATEEIKTFLPLFLVSEKVMKKLTALETTPKIMAICSKPKLKKIGGLALILDNIQDPGNLGTIIRSAVAFNTPNIILSETCVDEYNEKVIRGSEGMLFYVNIIRASLEKIIPFLKKDNYKIIGTSLQKGTDLKNINFKNNVAVVIGNEGNGISFEVQALCDEFISIKMNKKCESLNAGVSASIIMHEANK